MRRNNSAEEKIKAGLSGQSFLLGITGGVGAGKSRVLSTIKADFPVFLIEADEVGRELMEPGKAVFSALVAHYGEEILLPDGMIDRRKLAEIGLRDEESQRVLNELEHPVIKDEILRRIQRIEEEYPGKTAAASVRKSPDENPETGLFSDGGSEESGCFFVRPRKPVILLEAALLVEGGLSDLCDEVWYIFAPKEERIRRLMKSRGYSRKKALSVMARQLTYREFRTHSDYLIHNGSDFTITQAEIHRRMKEIFTYLCDSEA